MNWLKSTICFLVFFFLVFHLPFLPFFFCCFTSQETSAALPVSFFAAALLAALTSFLALLTAATAFLSSFLDLVFLAAFCRASALSSAAFAFCCLVVPLAIVFIS